MALFAALTPDRRAPLPGLDRDAVTGPGLLLLPAGLVSGMELPLRIDAVGAVAFLGPVPTALTCTSHFAGLHHAGAAAGVAAFLLEPLTATLLAALFGHDRLGGAQILGAFLVMVSIGVQQAPARTTATRRGIKPASPHPKDGPAQAASRGYPTASESHRPASATGLRR